MDGLQKTAHEQLTDVLAFLSLGEYGEDDELDVAELKKAIEEALWGLE